MVCKRTYGAWLGLWLVAAGCGEKPSAATLDDAGGQPVTAEGQDGRTLRSDSFVMTVDLGQAPRTWHGRAGELALHGFVIAPQARVRP